MSVFADLEDLVSDSVDEYFGNEITVLPQHKVSDYGSAADNDRPTFTVLGVIDFIPETIKAKGKEGNDGFLPNLTGKVAHVSIRDEELQSKGMPKQGDVFTATLKDGPVSLKISAIHPDKLGRTVFVCT
ncbi:hypothetical protein [Maritalea porphyrae]|uniref:hypothetical protein n=1 Tax=Maritalea porphyrae TaxID=880732 RepID=UPI0022AE7A19|nr:hypothetical protein [Maritalea porphyrae]MCZ4270722.1 hypothetical protein [Maritalea porphyrae]